MNWIKYRYKYSYGVGKWEYTDLGEMPIDDFLEEDQYKHDYEDHYRGIEFKVLTDLPPREWFIEQLEHINNAILVLGEQKKEYLRLMVIAKEAGED